MSYVLPIGKTVTRPYINRAMREEVARRLAVPA